MWSISELSGVNQNRWDKKIPNANPKVPLTGSEETRTAGGPARGNKREDNLAQQRRPTGIQTHPGGRRRSKLGSVRKTKTSRTADSC